MKLVLTKEEILKLPKKAFTGRIHLAENESQAKEIVKYLQGERILGFDTESKPAFKKGQSYPIGLLQLASEKHACLFRISRLEIPPSLKRILESKRILKVSQEPLHELRMIETEHGIKMNGVVDLGKISTRLSCSPRSLKALAAIFLGISISKKAQTSNWEKDPLSEQQMLYAATDAWVSRQVLMKIKNKNLIEEIPILEWEQKAVEKKKN